MRPDSFPSNSTSTQSKDYEDTFAEWDEWETIEAVRNSLAIYHDVELIEADNQAYNKLNESKPDIVFNIAEGMNGISRESQIPAILDLLSIPYTASDPLTLATCLHKGRTKEILSYHGVPNTRFVTFNTPEQFLSAELEFPVIIKPNGEGSSKGIFNDSLIPDRESVNGAIDKMLGNYDYSLIAEEYLPGKEFTVAIMGNDEEAEALPIIEMNFDALPENINHIYSYEAKWIYDSPEHQLDLYKCPAEISRELKEKIEDVALAAYKVLNCKDWSRIDIRLDKDENPHIIEVNPLPGILPDPKNNSCYPKAARMAGLTYEEMINNVLYFALKRYKMI